MKSKITLLSLASFLLVACSNPFAYSPDDTPSDTPPIEQPAPDDSGLPTPPQPHPTYPPRPKPIPNDDTACIEIYEPVCGKIQVQCITTPCDPVWETFSNRCYAEKANAMEIREGECN